MKTKKFSIKFYPRQEKITNQGLIPIYCRIMADKKIELSTTKMIRKGEWNAKTQRVRSCNHDTASINAYLDAFQSKVLDAHTKMFIEKQPLTADALKAAIFGKVIKEKTLLDVVIEHNIAFEKRIGIDYSYGSYKNYKTTKKYLEAFLEHQYKKKDISINDVNYSFCEHYFAFLITCRPCKNNGANKHIQRLKKIVNYAYKMGYVQTNNLLSYSLKFNPFHQHKLTWEEIDKLQTLNLQNDALSKVLDIFLFQCFTGLAYSDVKKFSDQHLVTGVDGNLWISMSRTKTKKEFSVPILKPAQMILDKYSNLPVGQDESIFPVLSNQKMNAYLKVVGEIAGLNKSLSCHVARHTFATTVTLQEGVPLETVSKLLGHSKIATTQIYSVVTQLKIMRDFKQLSEKLNEK
jgi:site-specific recombinase XerD